MYKKICNLDFKNEKLNKIIRNTIIKSVNECMVMVIEHYGQDRVVVEYSSFNSLEETIIIDIEEFRNKTAEEIFEIYQEGFYVPKYLLDGNDEIDEVIAEMYKIAIEKYFYKSTQTAEELYENIKYIDTTLADKIIKHFIDAITTAVKEIKNEFGEECFKVIHTLFTHSFEEINEMPSGTSLKCIEKISTFKEFEKIRNLYKKNNAEECLDEIHCLEIDGELVSRSDIFGIDNNDIYDMYCNYINVEEKLDEIDKLQNAK